MIDGAGSTEGDQMTYNQIIEAERAQGDAEYIERYHLFPIDDMDHEDDGWVLVGRSGKNGGWVIYRARGWELILSQNYPQINAIA